MPLFCPLQECSILKLQSVSLPLHLQPWLGFLLCHLQ